MIRIATCAKIAATVALVTFGAPSFAQPIDRFYEGKTINLYIGFAAGGSYDLYGRMVARHLGKQIPGHPTIVAHTMAGAGSFRAANYLYSIAPKDGTAIGIVSQSIAIEEAMQAPGVLFKAAEFGWIGRATNITEVMLTWHTSPTKTFADALVNDTPIGTTGPGSPSEAYPKLLNGLRKTKFKIIGGYPASANALLAMEKGEVDAAFTSWDTLKASKRDWIEQKRVNILVQFNTRRLSELPDVPSGVELAVTEDDRKILEFYISGAEVGRSFTTTPGIPVARLRLLRSAFIAMTQDEEFRADLARSKADLNPMSGEDLQELIMAVSRTPAEVIGRMQGTLKEMR